MENSITEIVSDNLCVGCGACIANTSFKMIWSEQGFLIPENTVELNSDNTKYCPFSASSKDLLDEDDLAKEFLINNNHDFKIGSYENTYSGFSNKFRETSSSGGIATFIFEKLLKNKIVDHLFIVKEHNGSYSYQWFNEVNSITSISKTRYIPVTLENLFKEIGSKKGSIAVSGVACFLKAIRLRQHYDANFNGKVKFLVGIICGGLKSRSFTEFLVNKSGIDDNIYRNQEYRIKDPNSLASDYSFGAFGKNDSFNQVKMVSLGDMWGTGLFKSHACDFCTDVTTELADISLGDAWLPEYRSDGLGTSVIITRSLLADEIINEGIISKELTVQKISKEKIIQSQKSSFSHRQDAIGFRAKIVKTRGMLVPNFRKRFVKPIQFSYKLVQLQRMRTRLNSLKIWSKYRNSHQFQKKIKNDLIILRILTKIYHKTR